MLSQAEPTLPVGLMSFIHLLQLMQLQKRFLAIFSMAFLVGGCTSLSQPVIQPGGWEAEFSAFMLDARTNTYQPWGFPKEKMCLSDTYLRTDPYLNPAVEKGQLEKNGDSCVVSDAVRSATTATWKIVCTSTDGTALEMKTQSTVASQEIRLVTYATKKSAKGDFPPVKTERKLTRIGDCTPSMVQR